MADAWARRGDTDEELPFDTDEESLKAIYAARIEEARTKQGAANRPSRPVPTPSAVVTKGMAAKGKDQHGWRRCCGGIQGGG